MNLDWFQKTLILGVVGFVIVVGFIAIITPTLKSTTEKSESVDPCHKYRSDNSAYRFCVASKSCEEQGGRLENFDSDYWNGPSFNCNYER